MQGTRLFSASHPQGSQETPDRQGHRTKLKQDAWASKKYLHLQTSPLPSPPTRHRAHKTEKKSHTVSRYTRKNKQRSPTQKGRPRRGARASLEPPGEGGVRGDPGKGLLSSREVVRLQGAAPQHAALASLPALHGALPRKAQ